MYRVSFLQSQSLSSTFPVSFIFSSLDYFWIEGSYLFSPSVYLSPLLFSRYITGMVVLEILSCKCTSELLISLFYTSNNRKAVGYFSSDCLPPDIYYCCPPFDLFHPQKDRIFIIEYSQQLDLLTCLPHLIVHYWHLRLSFWDSFPPSYSLETPLNQVSYMNASSISD